jgi:hypothetical protein
VLNCEHVNPKRKEAHPMVTTSIIIRFVYGPTQDRGAPGG